jgi:DNA-binding protein H-NS
MPIITVESMSTKTYRELVAERESLNAQLSRAREEVIERIRGEMAELNISAADLARPAAKRSGKVKPQTVARFRDPLSGETWSGRGRPPHWMAGKDKAAFAI